MKIRKILASLLAVTVLGAVMPVVSVNTPEISITANAEETADYTVGEYGPLSYIAYSDHVEITYCENDATDVNIPSEIDGLPVTSIGDKAFFKCSALTSVTIPDSVTSIGESTFSICSSLTEIVIPEGVTNIGAEAFCQCPKLTEIKIPKSVTSIGQCAFAFCGNLTSITIENPECEIYDDIRTISSEVINGGTPYYSGNIYGYDNSTAQAYAEKYSRKFVSLGEAPAPAAVAGDANCDGKVSIADSTAILQHLGNQDKYGLSESGLKNADVDGNSGVSTNDALVIQKVDAKILTAEQLPLKK